MKIEDYDYIMVFTSHHRALYIYQRLVRKNIVVKLITAPNKINISCTQAVKFKEVDMEEVQKELQKK
jgi:putative Se/S carrier protein